MSRTDLLTLKKKQKVLVHNRGDRYRFQCVTCHYQRPKMAESGALNSRFFKHQEALALLQATFPYNHPKCVSKHLKIESDTELQHNLNYQQLFT